MQLNTPHIGPNIIQAYYFHSCSATQISKDLPILPLFITIHTFNNTVMQYGVATRDVH